MQWFLRGGVVTLGLLAGPGSGLAQIWPLQTGPGGDIVNQIMADFDRLRRSAPPRPDPIPLRQQPAMTAPAWTPPPPPPPRVRRAAAPRSAPSLAAAPAPAPAPAAAPASTPAVEPIGRKPDIEAVERRLAERERILRELQRDLVEERRLVDEWRGSQRAAR
jgi:hypothetical protein